MDYIRNLNCGIFKADTTGLKKNSRVPGGDTRLLHTHAQAQDQAHNQPQSLISLMLQMCRAAVLQRADGVVKHIQQPALWECQS